MVKKNRDTVPTAGCGNGQSCSVGIYVLPQGSTKEYFNTYTADRLETMKRDGRGVGSKG